METKTIKIEEESEDAVESAIDLLYRNHVIKEEMVIGPVVLGQAVYNYSNRHRADGNIDDCSVYDSEVNCTSKKRIKREFKFEAANSSSSANLGPRAAIDIDRRIPPAAMYTNEPPPLDVNQLHKTSKPRLDFNKPPFDASKTTLDFNKPSLNVKKPPLRTKKPPLYASKPVVFFKPQSFFDFDWVSLPDPAIPWHERREKFSENRGALGIFANPYQAFVSIWDRDVMNMIALETNRYAKQCIHQIKMGLDTDCENSFQSWWNDTNADELYVFIALIIAMGVVVKSDINEYWSINSDTFDTPNFGLHMSCRRFQLLGRLLHFTNNEVRPTNLTEFESRVYKVAPIVQHLNTKFQALFQLGHSIAIEDTLELKNTWPNVINKFIKSNAAEKGVKSYEVSDVESGYLWRFDVHAVEDKKTPEEITSLLLKLLEGLEYKGHTVFADNLINSPVLARLLKSRGFDCAGRLRLDSQYVPKQLTELNKQTLTPGTIHGFTSGDVDILLWRDVNIMPLISTYHGLQAYYQDKKLTPILVQDLNTCIKGLDQRDLMLAGYSIEKKGAPVWYKKFFRRLLNISVFNSFILHKESGTPEHPHPHVAKQRQFRKILVNMLLENHAKPSSVLQPIPANSSRVKLSKLALKHMPVEYAFDEEAKQQPRYPCARCHAVTQTRCPGCNVPLCLGSCFSKYHS